MVISGGYIANNIRDFRSSFETLGYIDYYGIIYYGKAAQAACRTVLIPVSVYLDF